MTILSEYRDKRKALRKLLSEMEEFVEATDVPRAARYVAIRDVHHSKIAAPMKELHLFPIAPFPYKQQEATAITEADLLKVENYLVALRKVIGYPPADHSAGRR